jgi:hypothetical protein
MSSTTSQNPPDIIDGPRKRQPSKRVTENGDIHTNKKAKTSAAMKKSLGTLSDDARRASVENVPEPVMISHSQPLHANRVLEAADGSDDDADDDDMPGLEDIEDDEDDEDEDEDQPEDDEAELRMIFSLPQLSVH